MAGPHSIARRPDAKSERARFAANAASNTHLDECMAASDASSCDAEQPLPHAPEPAMPHLHLPAAHSDADLALAADVAAAVGSEDLYVSWSHAEGAGLMPEVDALLREERPANPFAEAFAAILQGFAALARAVVYGGTPRPALPAPHDASRPAAAEEPSA
jgi:hypothetical protein